MDRLWSVFHEHRLRQLIGFGLTVGTLGFIGYLSTGVSLPDAIYGTISLFTINYIAPAMMGGTDAGVPLVLQIARFTAPLVTAGTALTALVTILRDEVDHLRARRMKEHVIVCGAGDRGKQLAIDLHEQDRRVVVIESDEGAELSPLRHRQIPVVVGDATDPSQLKRARAGRAERVIIVLDDDDTNARCLTALQTVPVQGHLQSVHCHVRSPSLDAYFTSRTTYTNIDPESRPGERQVEWFNIDRLAANILLNEHFGMTLQARAATERIEKTGESGAQPGIAIVGTSDLARNLLLQAATTWNELKKSAAGTSPAGREVEDLWPQLPVTVIDEGSKSWAETVRSMMAGLDRLLDIECVETSPFASGWDPSSADVAYVTAPDPIEALEIAHYLEVVKSGPAQIVVKGFVGGRGLATVLLEGPDRDDSIHMVNLIERTCTVEMVTHRLIQQLALENHVFQQVKRPNRPATEAWDQLGPQVREENVRAAIHHLEVKIPALGLEVAPTIGLGIETGSFVLSDDDVETLMKLERERRTGTGHREIGGAGGQSGAVPAPAPAEDELRERAKGLPMMLNACGYRLVRPE